MLPEPRRRLKPRKPYVTKSGEIILPRHKSGQFFVTSRFKLEFTEDPNRLQFMLAALRSLENPSIQGTPKVQVGEQKKVAAAPAKNFGATAKLITGVPAYAKDRTFKLTFTLPQR